MANREQRSNKEKKKPKSEKDKKKAAASPFAAPPGRTQAAQPGGKK
jgi:hypothetical protein